MTKKYLVQDCMTFNIPTFDKNDKLTDAIKMMSENNIRYILIIENGKPIGVVDESNILLKVLAKGLDYKKLKCGDIMNKVHCVQPNDTITYVSQLMKQFNVLRFPVTENGRILGVIEQAGILEITHDLHEKNRNVKFHHQLQMLLIACSILFIIGFVIYYLAF